MLWNKDFTLKSDVEDKLNKVVKEFINYIEIPLPVADVHLVGSNCNYNYTKSSDLDVHLIVNFDLVPVDNSIL